MKLNELNQKEKDVILNKHTEYPFTGEYDNFFEDGIYVCKQCNQPLFEAQAKFDAGCGWPAFEDTYEGAVERIPQSDGRTEIVCSRCKGHLGHVFEGEKFTLKDTRHCVNSVSIRFIPRKEVEKFLEENKNE